MDDLLIFPFNGTGLEALDCIEGNYRLLGFIDDNIEKQGRDERGFSVYSREALSMFPSAKILAVPGNPNNFLEKKNIIDSLGLPTDRFATVIHKKAIISKFASIGNNILILAGTVVTSNSVIGDHVCILANTVVHHDTMIGDYSIIGSNVTIAGFTSVGKHCYIGSGSSLINGIMIGDGALIGMASNVIRNVPPYVKIAGNPGRIL